VELGNSVVVIEHNLDVIKTVDWIVELGSEDVAEEPRSFTGECLKGMLAKSSAEREAAE